MGFTQRQRRDIVMLRGVNWTYSEIAEYLNATYNADTSDSAVGREVRGLQSRAAEDGPRAVFDKIVLHGYIADFTGE